MRKKKITILGSTGSIGTQTLEVIAANPDRFCVTALTCGRNTALLAKQIAAFCPQLAVTERREDALALAAHTAGPVGLARRGEPGRPFQLLGHRGTTTTLGGTLEAKAS